MLKKRVKQKTIETTTNKTQQPCQTKQTQPCKQRAVCVHVCVQASHETHTYAAKPEQTKEGKNIDNMCKQNESRLATLEDEKTTQTSRPHPPNNPTLCDILRECELMKQKIKRTNHLYTI